MTSLRARPVTARDGVRYLVRGPRSGGGRAASVHSSLGAAVRRAFSQVRGGRVGTRWHLWRWERAGLSEAGEPGRRQRWATLVRTETGVLLRPGDCPPSRLTALRDAYQEAARVARTVAQGPMPAAAPA